MSGISFLERYHKDHDGHLKNMSDAMYFVLTNCPCDYGYADKNSICIGDCVTCWTNKWEDEEENGNHDNNIV